MPRKRKKKLFYQKLLEIEWPKRMTELPIKATERNKESEWEKKSE